MALLKLLGEVKFRTSPVSKNHSTQWNASKRNLNGMEQPIKE